MKTLSKKPKKFLSPGHNTCAGCGQLSAVQAVMKGLTGDKKTKVLVQGGDGGTFNIGLGLISGMWGRNENILYICYDTEKAIFI